MSDPFNLRRFLDAQSGVYAQALRELKNGQKRNSCEIASASINRWLRNDR